MKKIMSATFKILFSVLLSIAGLFLFFHTAGLILKYGFEIPELRDNFISIIVLVLSLYVIYNFLSKTLSERQFKTVSTTLKQQAKLFWKQFCNTPTRPAFYIGMLIFLIPFWKSVLNWMDIVNKLEFMLFLAGFLLGSVLIIRGWKKARPI